MCDEHNINTGMKTDRKDRRMINQIDGWNTEVKFNESGFSLENLVEEYIKEESSVYQRPIGNIRSAIIFLWRLNFSLIYYM